MHEIREAACADGHLPLIWKGIPDGGGLKKLMERTLILQEKCPLPIFRG